jgi:glucokinase
MTLNAASASGPVPVDASNGPGPVLALDLGGTHLRTAVVGSDGVIHARRHGRTPIGDGADAVIAAAFASLEASKAEHIADGGTSPVALGVSAPGPLDPARGVIIDPPNLGRSFWGQPLAPRLGDLLGLPWALERDTHVAILGERSFGAGVGLSDLVYLTISTGIGGAIISSGRLMTGPDGVAGELGHVTVDMDGPICGCGGRGHLERLTSGTGIALSAREALAGGINAPGLAHLAASIAPRPLESRHVAQAAEAGDAVAAGIIDRARRAFAAAVVSIVDVFNPQRIIVGGGIAIAWGDLLLQPARELVAATAFRIQARRVEIVPAQLGDDVGLIGTVALVATALAADGGIPHCQHVSRTTAVESAAG